jgi:putative transposase
MLKVSTTHPILNKAQNKKGKQSSTLGSRARISEKILKDKKNCSKNLTHQVKSFPTLQAELTSNEKDYRGFYTSSVKDLSNKLWLPNETDSLDLLTNSLRKFSNSTQPKSWFTVKTVQSQMKENEKSWMTSFPSILSSLQDYKVNEQLRIENEENQRPALKAKKTKFDKGMKMKIPDLVALKKLRQKTFIVRLYFSTIEKQVLKSWFGVSRKIYNEVIKRYRNKEDFSKTTVRCWVRDMKSEEWFKSVPDNVRDESIKQALDAIESNKSKIKMDQKGGTLGFRCKKDLRQVIAIRSQNLRLLDFSIYPTSLKKSCSLIDVQHKSSPKRHQKLRKVNWIRNILKDDENLSDCVLQWHRKLDHYNLVVRYTLPMDDEVREKQANQKTISIASIDPGVKTFATIYSPTEKIICKVGQGDYNRLSRLKNAYYKVLRAHKNLEPKLKRRKRHSFDKAAHRILFKMKNLVQELHRKLASWLVVNFDLIILPPFNQRNDLTIKKKGKWSDKNTRVNILSWSHCGFRKRLNYECEKNGKTMFIQEESYTSKTCSSCGWINDQLRNADVYVCKNMNCELYAIDRDLNGARNIFLKGLYSLLYKQRLGVNDAQTLLDGAL